MSETEIPIEPIRLSKKLSKLPRISVTTRAAPSNSIARSSGLAFGVTSPRKLSEAFQVKRFTTKD